MKSKYLSGICKLIYLITLILMFIVNKRNIQLPKITLILLVGINMFSFAANIFLSEISKKVKNWHNFVFGNFLRNFLNFNMI